MTVQTRAVRVDPGPSESAGPHNRLAIVVALCALALSAVTLLRVFGTSAAPRVGSTIADREKAIQAAFGEGDVQTVQEPKIDRPVESRAPVQVDSSVR